MGRSLDRANHWQPDPNDNFGPDQKTFLEFMIENCSGYDKAMPEKSILNSLRLDKIHSKEQLQHHVIVPLREQKGFFIGTSSKGIYFIDAASDAEVTIDFYTARIRSEHKHLRNLRGIVKRDNLFRNLQRTVQGIDRSMIFFDESGVPSLSNIGTDPFFIVSAVVIPNKRERKLLDKKFNYLRTEFSKLHDYEFKSTRLDKRKYVRTLKELSTVDYSFASVCFIKKKLSSEGFKHPKSFYKYAFRFLVDRVLDFVVDTDLYFDEYSDVTSRFTSEFLNYLKDQTIGFPKDRIRRMDTVLSASEHGVQLADLISGVIKNRVMGDFDLLPLIEEKMIALYHFPLD